MAKGLQAKLLRALEAGEVRRIGENETRRVDVRFVAATNLDIQAAMEAGEFRSDLFYRLNVHRIHLPPLRDRGEDVRLLSEHFLGRYGGGAVAGCTPAAWEVLTAYPYPGNVRQLQHVIQRAVAVARGRARSMSPTCPRRWWRRGRWRRRPRAAWPRRASAPSAR